MGYFRKKIERRTFSQDRYYILIKRQKSGEATMRDLIELDEIVNRDPDIREKVLRENFAEFNAEEPGADNLTSGPESQKPSGIRVAVWKRLGNFFKSWFTTDIHATAQKFSILC
jgi:hypothetical protein